MIIVLDSSAAIEFSLQRPKAKKIETYLANTEYIIAPDLMVSEITNVFWKYHNFEDFPLKKCMSLLEITMNLIDRFYSTKELYQEAFAFSCQVSHSVYDIMYLILARRHNAHLLTLDKKLQKLATAQSILTIGIE